MKTKLWLAGVLVLSGCASYPGGMTKEEWDALSPRKQAEYRRLADLEHRQKVQDGQQDQQRAQETIRDVERRTSAGQ